MTRDRKAPGRGRRAEIARLAARLMVDDAMVSMGAARAKAARRLGVSDRRELPTPAEIDTALGEYQRLFGGAEHRRTVRHLRETALAAMKLLAQFHPRLVGRVLAGTAQDHSAVTLHLFADAPEELVLFLLERHIPNRGGTMRVRDPERGEVAVPCYRFIAGDVEVELLVFPLVDRRRAAPLSAIDGRPMQRAGCVEVERLIASAATPSGPDPLN